MTRSRERFWKIFFVVFVLFAIAYLVYAYYFSPIEYKVSLNWTQILLVFCLSIFPSILSRLYANLKTGQVDANLEGFFESFRDCIHGTYMYWILLFIAIALWNYLVTGKLPWEWEWW